MYYIDIKSNEQEGNKEPYETVIKISITDILFERYIKLQLTDNPRLINMYYNPLFKFLGISPFLITIDSSIKNSASQSKEMVMEQEMNFRFSTKSNHYLFEKKILQILIKYMDRELLHYEREYIAYGEK